VNRGWVVSAMLCAVAALTVGCAPTAQAAIQAGLQATVTRVVDGDTIHATDAHGSTIKTRVLGIDTPEVVDPRKPKQCWGAEASAFAKSELLGQRVSLVADPTQDARDRYGRALFYIRLADGRDYSIEAVRAGMARSYVYDRKPVLEHAAIVAAEDEAKAARRGLWGRCLA
jgi:micrococcal nuclease